MCGKFYIWVDKPTDQLWKKFMNTHQTWFSHNCTVVVFLFRALFLTTSLLTLWIKHMMKFSVYVKGKNIRALM